MVTMVVKHFFYNRKHKKEKVSLRKLQRERTLKIETKLTKKVARAKLQLQIPRDTYKKAIKGRKMGQI